ncbi:MULTISPECIES: hypothetical protein [Sphingomonas]|jgi:lipopolysaccharide assembly protein A|uniref:hypothetical protein n=1 Tax=Sphingomonas TaxID=13687 RepID=UPI0017B0782C|nr:MULTISPECIES: hypothetical protein [Sphingomonas]MBB4047739.1 putative integral membrane protein [Sphingomonas zeae]MDK8185555.1 hypothetical protein [Sphingomonas zeae]MDK8216778.1 hypothetical protein [Sphingomonas sp. UMB7805-LC452B]
MQFLKMLFWCLLAFLAAAFTLGNWTTVPIRLVGGLVADVNLPLLLFLTFLLGLVPTLIWQHTARWKLRQRLSAAERSLAAVSTETSAYVAPVQSVTPNTQPTV